MVTNRYKHDLPVLTHNAAEIEKGAGDRKRTTTGIIIAKRSDLVV